MPPRYLTLETGIFHRFINGTVRANFGKLPELDIATSQLASFLFRTTGH